MRSARAAPSSSVSACGRVIAAYGSACVVVTPRGLCQTRISASPTPSIAAPRVFALLAGTSGAPSNSSGALGSRRSPSITTRPADVTLPPAIAPSAVRRERLDRSATRTFTRTRSLSGRVLIGWCHWRRALCCLSLSSRMSSFAFQLKMSEGLGITFKWREICQR